MQSIHPLSVITQSLLLLAAIAAAALPGMVHVLVLAVVACRRKEASSL